MDPVSVSPNPPPPVSPVSEPEIIAPPPRPSLINFAKIKPFLFGFLGLIAILILIRLGIGIFGMLSRSRMPSQSSVSQVPQVSQPTPEITPSGPTPVPEIPRLSLNLVSGRKLVGGQDSKLYLVDFTPQGPRKSQLYDLKYQARDFSLSPSADLLAVIYSQPGRSDISGLGVLNLKDNSFTEYIAVSESKSVSHPVWSADSLYLGVWNQGKSASIFDMAGKKRLQDITAGPGQLIGQIVFVPTQPKYSFVLGDSLYENEYQGNRQVKILDGISAVRSVPGQRLLPDTHFYTSANDYVVYHNLLGQLVLFNKTDLSQQILAEGNANPDKTSFSFGGVYYLDGRQLVYYDLGKPTYQPGIDDNPLKVINLDSKKSTPFFDVAKTAVSLASGISDPSRRQFVVQNLGYNIYRTDRSLVANCDFNNFRYPYYNSGGGIDYLSPLLVWSPDSQYLLNISDNTLSEAKSCAVSAAFDSVRYDAAIWIK